MVSYKKHSEAAQYNQPEHLSALQFSNVSTGLGERKYCCVLRLRKS